jgi:cation diffusion facilitator CzcD-associated flavoprotein CzcO
MIKRSVTLLMLSIMLLTAGCGIIENVGQTVNFATETTNYLQSLTDFGQDMNALAEQAMTDLDARTDLKERLLALKEQVQQYGALQVPDYAKELHQSISNYNETLQQGLDQALTNIEQGRAAFESTGIPETINKINELLNQINQLAP